MRPFRAGDGIELINAQSLAGRIADQLEAAAEILRQKPLASGDVLRVERQLEAEVSLLVITRRAIERAER